MKGDDRRRRWPAPEPPPLSP
ncbi:hypothetical protein A2U01_0086550, partial [Trifolium medium]|nr:hypothetical protein [Trifolium medium]